MLSAHPLLSVAIPLVWQWTPFMMLILLAGLQSQPGDVLEAARVDGATGWQIFRSLTLPHLRQYIELAVLLGSIYILQAFDAIYTITRGISDHHQPALRRLRDAGRRGGLRPYSAEGVVIVIGTIFVATFALRVTSSLFQEGTR